VKITGLLSWFRESPATLRETILSTAPLIDELVCLDGRYKLFPHQANRSTLEETEAIEHACETAGIPVHIHQVNEPFDGRWGGEVAKRASLFRLGFETSPDWFYVFDADCHVQQVNAGWRRMLEDEQELNVATVMVADGGIAKPHPAFFRALPGLTVRERHWRYLVPGGPVLWDYPHLLTDQKRIPTFTHIVVEHRSRRSRERARARAGYYELRDQAGIEQEPKTSPRPPAQTVDYAAKLRRALTLGSGGTPGGGRTDSQR
jgi:PAS domain-containing protein